MNPDFWKSLSNRFVDLIVSANLVTKIVSCVVLLLYIPSTLVGESFFSLFALVPANALFHFRFWTFGTYIFLETHFPHCFLSVMTLLLSSNTAFSVTSFSRLLYLFVFVTILTAFTVVSFGYFLRVFMFGILGIEYFHQYFYGVPFNGFVVICSGIMMLLRQHVPDLRVMWSIRGSQLIYLYGLCIFLLSLYSTHVEQLLLFFISSSFSWYYLRFLEKNGHHRGDREVHFSFQSFFPSSFEFFLFPLSQLCFKLFVLFKLIPENHIKDDVPQQQQQQQQQHFFDYLNNTGYSSIEDNEEIIEIDQIKMNIAEKEIERRLQEKISNVTSSKDFK